MPTFLLSFKRGSDSDQLVHGFLTPNPRRSEKAMDQHATDCPKFGPAVRAQETIEVEVEVDRIPEFTQEAIEEWVDDLLGLEEEDEDEDDDEITAEEEAAEEGEDEEE